MKPEEIAAALRDLPPGTPWWLALEAAATTRMSRADDVGTYSVDTHPEEGTS